MDKYEITQKPCLIGEKDKDGDPNLCCCYVMDENGNYKDPCYQPVDGCCLLSQAHQFQA